jgi:hypothetical protein
MNPVSVESQGPDCGDNSAMASADLRRAQVAIGAGASLKIWPPIARRYGVSLSESDCARHVRKDATASAP